MTEITSSNKHIEEAIEILTLLGLPSAQQNERSALCLLALLDIDPTKTWKDASNPLIGITPMMSWISAKYGKTYAPNTRETLRKLSMHQFVLSGIAKYNPDDPKRAVNSPKTVYQIEFSLLSVLQTFGSTDWEKNLASYSLRNISLNSRFARERKLNRIPLKINQDLEISLSQGEHSELIGKVIVEFGSRFVPGGELVYVGDTGKKWGFFDSELLEKLGVFLDAHGKMPDVIIFDRKKNWLLLIEAVTSHGAVDGKRHSELSELFSASTAGLVFVTAFPDRALMSKYIGTIAWETEVWVSEAPSHLIHFNGKRFLGPYKDN